MVLINVTFHCYQLMKNQQLQPIVVDRPKKYSIATSPFRGVTFTFRHEKLEFCSHNIQCPNDSLIDVHIRKCCAVFFLGL